MCIGVAAVITLVAVGNGSKQAVEASIDALGTNVLVVQAQRGGFGPGALRRVGDDDHQDASALTDAFDAPDVKSASPVVQAQSTTLVSGSTSYSPSSFVGTTPSLRDGARHRRCSRARCSRAPTSATHARVA